MLKFLSRPLAIGRNFNYPLKLIHHMHISIMYQNFEFEINLEFLKKFEFVKLSLDPTQIYHMYIQDMSYLVPNPCLIVELYL